MDRPLLLLVLFDWSESSATPGHLHYILPVTPIACTSRSKYNSGNRRPPARDHALGTDGVNRKLFPQKPMQCTPSDELRRCISLILREASTMVLSKLGVTREIST